MKTKYRAVRQNEKILGTDEVRLKDTFYKDEWEPVSDPKYKEYKGDTPRHLGRVKFRRKVTVKPKKVAPVPVETRVEPAKESPMFKIGDKVRIDSRTHTLHGKEGEISEVRDLGRLWPYQVTFPFPVPAHVAGTKGAKTEIFKASELVLIPEEAPKAEEAYPNVSMPGANDPRYYYLKAGDFVEEGDEVITGLGWRRSFQVGYSCGLQGHEKSFRRLIKTEPKKYIFLSEGQTIKEGDEYLPIGDEGWLPVVAIGVGLSPSNVGKYRREVK
jgi:hypothetical protein